MSANPSPATADETPEQPKPDALAERARKNAQERAEQLGSSESWGYRLTLDQHETFSGRFRGETTDTANSDRRVFLFWDADDQPCYSRTYKSLAAEMDREGPVVGDRIAVSRFDDYPTGFDNPGQSYGVAAERCDEPLPEGDLPF